MAKPTDEANKVKKEAFTIRVESELIESLARVGNLIKLKPATMARLYIQMAQFFLIQSSLDIQSFDGKEMTVLPRQIWLDAIKEFDDDRKLRLGDEMGILINNNSQMNGFQTIDQKVEFMRGLGWFEIRPFEERTPEKKSIYWGILAKSCPLTVIHAMLYRVLYNRQFPGGWMGYLRDHGMKTMDQLNAIKNDKTNKKENRYQDLPDIIQRFRDELGGRPENFLPDVTYYKLEKLKMEEALAPPPAPPAEPAPK
jgi:hypothetical protein